MRVAISQQLQVETLFANADSLFLVVERNRIECFTKSAPLAAAGQARVKYEAFRIQPFCEGKFKRISQFSKFVVFLTTAKQLFFYDRDTKAVLQPEPGLLFEAVCSSKNRLLAVAPLYAQLIIMTSQIYGSKSFDRVQRRVVQLSDYLPSVFAYQMKLANSIVLVESFAQGMRPKRESAIRDIGETRDAQVESSGRLLPFEKSEVTLKFIESREPSQARHLPTSGKEASPTPAGRSLHAAIDPAKQDKCSQTVWQGGPPQRKQESPPRRQQAFDAASVSPSSERKRASGEKEPRAKQFALGGNNLKSLYERLKKNCDKPKPKPAHSEATRPQLDESVQSIVSRLHGRLQSKAAEDSLAVSQSGSIQNAPLARQSPPQNAPADPQKARLEGKVIVVTKPVRTQDECKIDPIEVVCAAPPLPRLTASNLFSLQISASPGLNFLSQQSKDSRGSSVVLRSLELASSKQKAVEEFVFKSGPALSDEAESKLTAMVKSIKGMNEVISPVSSHKQPPGDSPQPVCAGPAMQSFDEAGKCYEIGLDGSKDYRRPPSSPFEQADTSRRSSQRAGQSAAVETRSVDSERRNREVQVVDLSGFYQSGDLPFRSGLIHTMDYEDSMHHVRATQLRDAGFKDSLAKSPLALFRTTPVYSSPADPPMSSQRMMLQAADSPDADLSLHGRRVSKLPPRHSRDSSTHRTLPHSLNASKLKSPADDIVSFKSRQATDPRDAPYDRRKSRPGRDSCRGEESQHSRSRSRHSRSSSINRTTETIYQETCERLRHHLIALPDLQPHDSVSFFASEVPNPLYRSTDSARAARTQTSALGGLCRILKPHSSRIALPASRSSRSRARAGLLSECFFQIKKHASDKVRHLKTAAIVCHTLQSKVIVSRLRAAFDLIYDESREKFVSNMKHRLQEKKTSKLHSSPIDASKRPEAPRANQLIRRKSPEGPKKPTVATNAIPSTSARQLQRPVSSRSGFSRTCIMGPTVERGRLQRSREESAKEQSREKSSKQSTSRSQVSGCLKKPATATTTSCSLFATPQRPESGGSAKAPLGRDRSSEASSRARVRFDDC